MRTDRTNLRTKKFHCVALCGIMAIGALNCDPVQPADTASQAGSRILFERRGGGDKEFTAVLLTGPRTIDFTLTRYNFKDTAAALSHQADTADSQLVDAMKQIQEGRAVLTKSAACSSVLTGSWVYIYSISPANDTTEITNIELRDRLMRLETIIDSLVN